jgi:hypothetical protein
MLMCNNADKYHRTKNEVNAYYLDSIHDYLITQCFKTIILTNTHLHKKLRSVNKMSQIMLVERG